MSTLATITITTKVDSDGDPDDVARELTNNLWLMLERSAIFESVGDDHEVETTIQHYLVTRPPLFLPEKEARVTATAQVWA
jgi:hypothetical protein